MSQLWPLFEEAPGLAEIPRVTLRAAPTPVEQVGERLWIKRDDLNAVPVGGNKVRSLEFLLAQFCRGDRVITGGSRGSTHVLSTVLHAKRLGIEVDAASWPQEMNVVAQAVDARLEREVARRHFRHPVSAAAWLTWKAWRGQPVIPAGGTSVLGMLGHVNAALELAEQVRAGLLPQPERVIVPFGTGGTAAGLALGLSMTLNTSLWAVRVVPSIVARRSRLRRLSHALQRTYGLKPIRGGSGAAPEITVIDHAYGGAYGRPLPGAPGETPNHVPLDATYSAKAFVVALESAREVNTLFWHTFDSRWMHQ